MHEGRLCHVLFVLQPVLHVFMWRIWQLLLSNEHIAVVFITHAELTGAGVA
jgi:hypothetical protein